MDPVKSTSEYGAEEDATVRVSPGGPPPPSGYKDGPEWKWSLSSTKQYLKISVGSRLELKQNGKGYVIKIKPKPKPKKP
jgi:hypothetical protein